MAIYKRGDKYWISIYRGAGKPRKYLPAGTDCRETALAMEAMIKTAMNGNMARDRLYEAIDSLMGWNQVPGVIVGDLWATYLKTKPTVGPHTMRQRESLCRKLSDWLTGKYPATKELHQITPQQAFEFSDWLLEEKGGKGKTHNNRIGNLKTVFKAIQVRANINENPFGLHGKMSESDSVHGRPFTDAEQAAIFARCCEVGKDWLAICTVSKYSGARLKDLAQLKWDQVTQKHIDITPAKTKKHGIRALIPIHVNVSKELNMLDRSGEYVFPTLAARYLENDRSESGFMEDIMNPIDIDREGAHITFHCWRHTFRTMMAAAKVPADVAMKIAGWTNEETAELYNHDFSQMQEAIDALE
ncbi:hypothetical protein PDESU_03294 [Pontiella desulfatans]|uniref:Defective protein IntQ n=1 Tax=Pontiella desulfatans TaxID=2750659 RepID=A0A6C2U499_PONDE|nr:tyrosine-type recombinase/integrase [Pontiella desulfatans]VGO14725.1 hypothetical protein PDESU_03294 [Pontiella desulfatans]